MTAVFQHATLDTRSLIAPARAAMIRLWRTRARVASVTPPSLFEEPTVSAIDLANYLDIQNVGGDRRWSGVVFTSPRALWRRIGYIRNPRRHDSPTPLFTLNEQRAKELGL